MFTPKHFITKLKSKPECLINFAVKATICHKSELPPQKNYHFPYEQRKWGAAGWLWDPRTKKKFNENSKIIQVEGNINSGKDDFARRLANELGMKYMEDVDLESYYINDHGYDYRALNPLLPERMRLCDWEMYHENPTRHSFIHMQHYLSKLRLEQYIKALQHLFNTGQGVVLKRSLITERVFVEAMHDIGWLPMGYLRGDGVRFYDWKMRYVSSRNLLVQRLPRPHLTIYLHVPVETCLERIKNSSEPIEANSKALTPEFLEAIERSYENVILPKVDNNGHLLTYETNDRITDDELSDVIDDIKELDFEFDHHDTRFETWDWEVWTCWHLTKRRYFTTDKHKELYLIHNTDWYDIAGLGDSITQIDIKLRQSLFEGHVGPMGLIRSFESDSRFNNIFTTFFGWQPWGTRIRKYVRSDFV